MLSAHVPLVGKHQSERAIYFYGSPLFFTSRSAKTCIFLIQESGCGEGIVRARNELGQ